MFLAPRKNVAKDLRCAMNGQEIMEKNKMIIKHKNARKKRDAKDSDSGEENEQSIGSKAEKYGCPTNYKRISEYICLRYGTTDDKTVDLVTNYEEAKRHCAVDGAKLLYFSNSDEALKIWKWLGKYQ